MKIKKYLIKQAERYPIALEFIKFCLVGFTNMAVDFIIYFLLSRVFGLYYIWSAMLAFLVAVTWSFYINRHWTFKYYGTDIRTRYIKFFIANSISIAVNIALLYVFVDWLGIYDLLSKLIAIVIVSFLNFGINKFWTFR